MSRTPQRKRAASTHTIESRAILDAIPDMVFVLSKDGTYLDFIPGAGVEPIRPPNEILGLNIKDVIPDIADELLAAMAKALAGKGAQALSYKLDYDNGAHWFEARVAKSGANEVLVVVRDRTHQHEIESSLREMESFLEKSQEIARVGSWSIDLATQKITWSPELYRIFGLTPDQFDGSEESSMQTIHPDDLPEVRSAFEGLFQRQEAVPLEYRVVHPDGTELCVSAHGDFVRDDAGNVITLVGTVQDITEQKRINDALAASERNARAVLEAIPDMVFLVDRNGIHLDYIPGQDTDPILPAKELMGRSVRETLPEAADLIMAAVDAALSGNGTQTVSYTLTYEDGLHHLEARISDAGDDKVIALIRDVTDRVQMLAELESARDALESRAERQLERGNPYDLTFREFTVLNLVAEGKTDKAIAAELGISPLTVHRHVSNIRKKMDCGSRTEAGTRAIREGLID